VPPPEQLERLFLTPQYQDLRNRIFGLFLNFLVQTELVGKQQAGQITNFWQENNHSETQEDNENDEKGSLQHMDVDTRKSHLSTKRPEDSKEYEPEKNKKAPRTANFECRKGCGYVGTKAGPLSQRIHACNGKPWDVQK
jgi:hypothetical protein